MFKFWKKNKTPPSPSSDNSILEFLKNKLNQSDLKQQITELYHFILTFKGKSLKEDGFSGFGLFLNEKQLNEVKVLQNDIEEKFKQIYSNLSEVEKRKYNFSYNILKSLELEIPNKRKITNHYQLYFPCTLERYDLDNANEYSLNQNHLTILNGTKEDGTIFTTLLNEISHFKKEDEEVFAQSEIALCSYPPKIKFKNNFREIDIQKNENITAVLIIKTFRKLTLKEKSLILKEFENLDWEIDLYWEKAYLKKENEGNHIHVSINYHQPISDIIEI